MISRKCLHTSDIFQLSFPSVHLYRKAEMEARRKKEEEEARRRQEEEERKRKAEEEQEKERLRLVRLVPTHLHYM